MKLTPKKTAKADYLREYRKRNMARLKEYAKGYRDKKNAARRKRYAEDEEHRNRLKQLSREWARKNPLKCVDQDLRENYGIGLTEYNRILLSQGGVCAICGDARTARGGRCKRLYVDHSHNTKTIRGILCPRCNFGIGHFKDDPQLLRRAAEYLERNKLNAAA